MSNSKLTPRTTADTVAQTMGEKTAPYSPREAVTEANRCLFCYDAPCIGSCPTGIDIPSFIKKIATGNTVGSARAILEANILGASCARVCPTEVLCEGACVVGDDYDPVAIGRLQRFATDHVFENNIEVIHANPNKTGKKVAVVGGGPAGLAAAAELAKLGHSPTIFEKKDQAGGLNTYGIAYYKMKPQVSLEEVDLVRSLGVEIKTGITVGEDVSGEELREDFDAIFLGLGLGAGVKLKIPGEDAPEVCEAVDFIQEIRSNPLHEVAVGAQVLVIGGGNTAIDAASQSKRLGADTATLCYRRGQAEMSAYDFEQDLAKHDDCDFLFNAAPLEIITEDGHVSGVKFAKTKVEGSAFSVDETDTWIETADMVILAVGQSKQSELAQQLFPDLVVDAKGRVTIDSLTGATSVAGLYSGGDCTSGGSEVVNAVGEGKKAAFAIHEFLGGEAPRHTNQPSRSGAQDTTGSGILAPVRVPQLEADHFAKN